MDRAEISRRSGLILCLALAAAALLVYGQVKDHEFVTFDDQVYVIENPHVRSGLTRQGILWAFSSSYAANWHPLTWISHMLDCELYGLNPSGHHLNNVLFHICGTLLLFLALKRMTGATWRSFLAAALFALHPLHVESVAWVSERKDVLSGLFWMAALYAYARYAERPSGLRYSWVFLLFLFGLMSKPMTVTLPFVLLLLDYWPLNRLGRWRRALLEKAPLFALSAASSWITFVVQDRWGAVTNPISFHLRAANSLVSYVIYVEKMFFPSGLSFFYPHPMDSLSVLRVSGSLLLLALVTFLAFRFSSKTPYFTVGWLWYLGTLVPVIGLVQVGLQGMADRYTYIPLTGLFVLLSWGSADLVKRFGRLKAPALAFWIASVALLSLLCASRVEAWKNSVTLCRQAISVSSGHYLPHYILGLVFSREGRLQEAETHLKEALKLRPGDPLILNNLGNVEARQGRIEEGVARYDEALRKDPDFAEARSNRETALRLLSRRVEP